MPAPRVKAVLPPMQVSSKAPRYQTIYKSVRETSHNVTYISSSAVKPGPVKVITTQHSFMRTSVTSEKVKIIGRRGFERSSVKGLKEFTLVV